MTQFHCWEEREREKELSHLCTLYKTRNVTAVAVHSVASDRSGFTCGRLHCQTVTQSFRVEGKQALLLISLRLISRGSFIVHSPRCWKRSLKCFRGYLRFAWLEKVNVLHFSRFLLRACKSVFPFECSGLPRWNRNRFESTPVRSVDAYGRKPVPNLKELYLRLQCLNHDDGTDFTGVPVQLLPESDVVPAVQ